MLGPFRDTSEMSPGSVRFLVPGKILGAGIVVGGGDSRRRRTLDGAFVRAAVSLDGVFFNSGAFAGPNTACLWERITLDAEAHTRIAALARRAHYAGLAVPEIIAAIEELTGPLEQSTASPPPLHPVTPDGPRQETFQFVVHRLAINRSRAGDEQTVGMVLAWADAELPRYRRLPGWLGRIARIVRHRPIVRR